MLLSCSRSLKRFSTRPRESKAHRVARMESSKRTEVNSVLSWSLVEQYAAKCNGVQSWKTNTEIITQNGVQFLIRVAEALASKPKSNEPKENGKFVDPFENPPTQDLYIKTITPTHSIMLNKFNVVDDHLLIVTNEFESQLEPLTENDFEALWLTVRQLEGLAFHNCGKKSGASQPHKHMQFIPLPIHQSLPDLPFEAAIRDGRKSTKLGEPFSASVATLPFVHWVSMVQEPGSNSQLSGKFLCETYKKLYQLVVDFEARQSATNSADMKKEDIHYNLLMTSRWMMIVPRSNEQHQNIFVNSLGFAGTMFVKSTEDADTLKRVGPFSILRCVGFDPAPAPEL